MSKRIDITEDRLKKLYIKRRLSIRKIAEIFNCVPSTIWTKLCQFNIKVRTKSEANKEKYRIRISKALLKYLYVDKELDTGELAKKFNCSSNTIVKRFRRYDIPIRKTRINVPRNKLEYLYVNKKKTIYQIAKKFNCDPVTISNRLNQCSIPIRKKGEVKEENREIKIPKDKLKYLYVDKGLTISEIVKMFNWSRGTVYKRLRRYDFVRSVSEASKGKPSAFKGKHHTPETKKKLSKATTEQLASGKMRRKDTSVESKMESELKRNNIYYQKQVPLCNISVVDFYLPEYKIVIYIDGDYWHNLSTVKDRDKKQNKILEENGYKVLRFWEHEINKSAEECINKIMKYIGIRGELALIDQNDYQRQIIKNYV
jgi:very-short-patch-repair endonuclease